MEYILHSHRKGVFLANNDNAFKDDFQSILDTIESITDDNLISDFNLKKLSISSNKSLSRSINEILKERLTNKGWKKESKIFKPAAYQNSAWRLDFAKNSICIEVSFNHGEAAAHNLMKTVIASELNHVSKEIQTGLGVIIVITEDLKIKGNFDGAVGVIEKYESYLNPYMLYLTTPLVLIGLKAPKTFYIDKKTKGVVMNDSNAETNLFNDSTN